jgi:hypothetical protein
MTILPAMTASLVDLVSTELAQPVDLRVTRLATAIARRYGNAASSVLFYGSCLRQAELDGLMLDFYLIVDDYGAAYGGGWLAFANRLIPPNVFPFEADGLAAKYAVLSTADFTRLASAETRNVSIWARFAQPSRLVWARDDAARKEITDSVCRAAPALLATARPMLPGALAPLDLWRGAFALTYGAELRAERKERGQSVVDAEPDRYHAFTEPALAAAGINLTAPVSAATRKKAAAEWRRRRWEGKALTLIRLAKATMTFAGGIDYIAWKINRHAGTKIVIKPWQRRWPIVGAITLLPRLLTGGAVR